eukprot:scpid108713/ scgid15739/ 
MQIMSLVAFISRKDIGAFQEQIPEVSNSDCNELPASVPGIDYTVLDLVLHGAASSTGPTDNVKTSLLFTCARTKRPPPPSSPLHLIEQEATFFHRVYTSHICTYLVLFMYVYMYVYVRVC